MENEINKKILKVLEELKNFVVAQVRVSQQIHRDLQEIKRELKRDDTTHTKT